jgi:hypothetical protein
MNVNRKWSSLFGSMIIALALVFLGLLSSVASGDASRLLGLLTPSAYVHLPVVIKDYPLATPTPSATPTQAATATPTSPPTATSTPTVTPTNPPAPTPIPGHWAGTTNLVYPMSFDVSADSAQWSAFTLETEYSAPECGASGTLTSVTDGPGDIVDSQFSYTSSTYSFTGQFLSAISASGTYDYDNFLIVIPIPNPPYVCFYYFTQSGTWTANGP